MMKIKFLFAFLLLTGFQTEAQNSNGKISGSIVDPQNKSVPGATIVLYNVKDTVSKQTCLADKNGSFSFKDLPTGTYSILVTVTGFRLYQDKHIEINDAHRSAGLPVIVLQPAANQTLKEVLITAKKPLIEQKIDRTIVNTDAMIMAAGGNALDALSKSPGVMVDANDNISLNGKSNVLVLIDNRPTYMPGQDLAAYLRSLPASIIDKLELISNPPAHYDASGGAVINIVLKKNHAAGFNGGLTLGYNQGVYGRSNEGMNINYRTAKFNIFSNAGYSFDQDYSDNTFSRYFYNSDGSLNTAVLQHSNYFYRSTGWTGRAGLDYALDSKTTLGCMLSGNTRPKTDLFNYTNHQYDGIMRLDSLGKGYTNGKYQWRNAGVNLNMQHTFGSAGSQLSADLDYLHFYSDANQYSPLYEYQADGSLANDAQRSFLLPAHVNIYSLKMDYTHPFAGKGKFDAGVKYSYVANDNQLNWFNQAGNNLVPDYSKTNHFRYAENIRSAYINLKKDWGRWGGQGGIRAEQTVAEGHQLGNPVIPDSSFAKKYINLFPSLYISYKLDTNGNHTLVFSYNKKVRRPGYQQLNPFLFYHDPYSYSSGNPGIVPYFNHYIELKYSYKQYVAVSAGYWMGNNETFPVTQATGNIFITRPYNFLNNRTFSLTPYFSFDPTRWWTFHINFVLLFIINTCNAPGVEIKQKTYIHEIETMNELRLAKTWSAELDGFFPGKQAFGQGRGDAVYNISGGIRKTILQGQGALHLTVNDMFNTMAGHSQTTGINQVAAFSTRQTDSRRMGISFSYRFGKAANERKRNHTTGGAEDEKGRAN